MVVTLVAGIALWAVAVLGGTVAMMDHGARPGETGTPPMIWPASSNIQLDRSRPTLVMVAHPRCPCTLASVEQLARLMTQAGGPAHVRAYFVISRPLDAVGSDRDWSDVPLGRVARRIPGVEVVFDGNATLATALGVRTSGHVLVYDPTGLLRFSGGITESRGHEGDNLGQAAIVSLILQGTATQPRSPVFGCPIQSRPAASSDVGEGCHGGRP